MKHCYIRFNEDSFLLHSNRYIEVILCKDESNEWICHLSGIDDWELSYAAPDAKEKFEALLEVSGEVTYEYLKQLGFTQYG